MQVPLALLRPWAHCRFTKGRATAALRAEQEAGDCGRFGCGPSGAWSILHEVHDAVRRSAGPPDALSAAATLPLRGPAPPMPCLAPDPHRSSSSTMHQVNMESGRYTAWPETFNSSAEVCRRRRAAPLLRVAVPKCSPALAPATGCKAWLQRKIQTQSACRLPLPSACGLPPAWLAPA